MPTAKEEKARILGTLQELNFSKKLREAEQLFLPDINAIEKGKVKSYIYFLHSYLNDADTSIQTARKQLEHTEECLLKEFDGVCLAGVLAKANQDHIQLGQQQNIRGFLEELATKLNHYDAKLENARKELRGGRNRMGWIRKSLISAAVVLGIGGGADYYFHNAKFLKRTNETILGWFATTQDEAYKKLPSNRPYYFQFQLYDSDDEKDEGAWVNKLPLGKIPKRTRILFRNQDIGIPANTSKVTTYILENPDSWEKLEYLLRSSELGDIANSTLPKDGSRFGYLNPARTFYEIVLEVAKLDGAEGIKNPETITDAELTQAFVEKWNDGFFSSTGYNLEKRRADMAFTIEAVVKANTGKDVWVLKEDIGKEKEEDLPYWMKNAKAKRYRVCAGKEYALDSDAVNAFEKLSKQMKDANYTAELIFYEIERMTKNRKITKKNVENVTADLGLTPEKK